MEERLAEQELDAHERELEKQKAGQEIAAASEVDGIDPSTAEPVAAS